MDIVGIALVSATVIGFIATGVIGRRRNRSRSASARAWARHAGIEEIAGGLGSHNVFARLKREPSLPAFRTRIAGVDVTIVPSRIKPRFAYVWVFTARLPGLAPTVVFSRIYTVGPRAFGTLRLGEACLVGDSHFDTQYVVYPHAGMTTSARLSEATRAALMSNSAIYAFMVDVNHDAFLMVREEATEDPDVALAQGLNTFERLLAA